MNTITMGELGEIGWYLKLEAVQDKNRGSEQRKERERERIKQPLFQFRYEGKTRKFIREIKDNASVDNATKDPNFVNGFFTNVHGSFDMEAEKVSPTKGEPDKLVTEEKSANLAVTPGGAAVK